MSHKGPAHADVPTTMTVEPGWREGGRVSTQAPGEGESPKMSGQSLIWISIPTLLKSALEKFRGLLRGGEAFWTFSYKPTQSL